MKPQKSLHLSIPLPERYRKNDFLAFHSRDAQQISEVTTSRGITKGILWSGCPAQLTIVFRKNEADVRLSTDGILEADSEKLLLRIGRRMLGLEQAVEVFEAEYAEHPLLGSLVKAGAGLRVPQTATPFEALSWAIIGQQVSVSAAVSIRRRFILAAGVRHSKGLWCFPDAHAVAALNPEILRGAGFSRSKAESLFGLSNDIVSGRLPIDNWLDLLSQGALDVSELQKRLLAVKGIGPWTVSYMLLRGFGWLDGSLHGDVAVRRNLAKLLGREDGIPEKEAEQWLAEFSPWRALVAAHLWAMQSRSGY